MAVFQWINVYNSFPVGLLFIYFGEKISKGKMFFSPIIIGIGVVIGLFALYVENQLINNLGCRYSDDCYISLVILAPAIVVLVKSLKFKLISDKFSVLLRKMSTICYCSHIIVIQIIKFCYNSISMPESFVFTLLICSCISIILIYLSKYKRLGFLKYSY